MKVTKRQLRRIIRESLNERFTRGPAEDNLRRAVLSFVDDYMMSMGMDPSDPANHQRTRRTINDIIATVLD